MFERLTTQFGYARSSPSVVHSAGAAAADGRHLLEGTCHRSDVRHGRLTACRAGRTQLLLLLHGAVLTRSRVHEGWGRTAASRRRRRRPAVAGNETGSGSHRPGRVVVRSGGRAEGRPGRRAEHGMTGDERRVHRRRSARRRAGGARYGGVVVGQGGSVVVPVHARRRPARLGRRRLSGWSAPGGGGGEVKESGVVDGAERR